MSRGRRGQVARQARKGAKVRAASKDLRVRKVRRAKQAVRACPARRDLRVLQGREDRRDLKVSWGRKEHGENKGRKGLGEIRDPRVRGDHKGIRETRGIRATKAPRAPMVSPTTSMRTLTKGARTRMTSVVDPSPGCPASKGDNRRLCLAIISQYLPPMICRGDPRLAGNGGDRSAAGNISSNFPRRPQR